MKKAFQFIRVSVIRVSMIRVFLILFFATTFIFATTAFSECIIVFHDGSHRSCEECDVTIDSVTCYYYEDLDPTNESVTPETHRIKLHKTFSMDLVEEVRSVDDIAHKETTFEENLKKYNYVGNLFTKKYFKTDCYKAKDIPPRGAVFYQDEIKFIDKGYTFEVCR